MFRSSIQYSKFSGAINAGILLTIQRVSAADYIRVSILRYTAEFIIRAIHLSHHCPPLVFAFASPLLLQGRDSRLESEIGVGRPAAGARFGENKGGDIGLMMRTDHTNIIYIFVWFVDASLIPDSRQP